MSITFKRLVKDESAIRLTTYEVFLDGKSIGFVWSEEGFSYRGTEGWSSGSPTEWHWGEKIDCLHTLSVRTRKEAVARLFNERSTK